MTQVTFALAENPVTAAKLNQAIQGYRFLRRSTFLGLTEPFIFNCHESASAFYARLVGPGGGGAGAGAGAPTDSAAGSGGGGGGYAERFENSPLVLKSTLYILAPQGGTGGIVGNNPGLAASSGAAIIRPSTGVSFVTVVSAIPGAGGNFMFPGTNQTFLAGGTGGFGFLGDLNMSGETGGVAIRFGQGVVISGRGGNAVFRGAGAESAPGAGKSAISFGAGGSGAASQGTLGQAGGTGGHGCVIFDEYY